MGWTAYLSGEIHTDWREAIEAGAKARGLDVAFSAPVTDHAASDDCGVAILGAEPDKFRHDAKGARMNAIRTRTLIEKADVVVMRFGEKYKQWNAAFDAGYAAALGKIIESESDTVARALQKRIDKLEREKALSSEKASKTAKTKQSQSECMKFSLGFLASTWNLNKNGSHAVR